MILKFISRITMVFVVAASSIYGASFTISNIVVEEPFKSDTDANSAVRSGFSTLESTVNSNLNIPDQKDFLKAMGNANSAATKGLGVDYASNPTLFVVGFGVGAAANLGNKSFSDLNNLDLDGGFPPLGASAQFAIMGGFNIGKVFSKIPIIQDSMVYAHFMTLALPDSVSNDLSARATNLGAHLQWAFIKPRDFAPLGMVKWGGVDFTSGLTYSKFKIVYKSNLTQSTSAGSASAGGDTYNLDGSFTGPGEVGVNITTVSLPIEASSSIRLAHFLSFFGGIGIDFNVGSGSSIGNVTGTVTIKGTKTSDGTTATAGTADAKLDLGDSKAPSFGDLRFFFGPQLDISAVKIFAQLNYSVSKSLGGVFGLRVAW